MNTLTELMGWVSQALSVLDQSMGSNFFSPGGDGGWSYLDVEAENLAIWSPSAHRCSDFQGCIGNCGAQLHGYHASLLHPSQLTVTQLQPAFSAINHPYGPL